jgi:hypothetical protein
MRLYIGLIHYPVYNKNYQKIASAITTFDLHDIARLARTYDVRKFYVITPLVDQLTLAERVLKHWTEGYGAEYNRHRKEAIELMVVVPSLERAADSITNLEGEAPLLITTDASRQKGPSVTFKGLKDIIQGEKVVLLLFGTAWGLHKTVLDQADYALDPIIGRTGYQHLSVRTAAAIIIDRLVGR